MDFVSQLFLLLDGDVFGGGYMRMVGVVDRMRKAFDGVNGFDIIREGAESFEKIVDGGAVAPDAYVFGYVR